MAAKSVVSESPDILGGEPVFSGTRVPVRTLCDDIIKGHPLLDFVDYFPSVTLARAAALDECKSRLLEKAHEAAAG